MKKIIITLLAISFLTGCSEKKEKETDYSEYSFTNVTWTRDSGHDIETIKLKPAMHITNVDMLTEGILAPAILNIAKEFPVINSHAVFRGSNIIISTTPFLPSG